MKKISKHALGAAVLAAGVLSSSDRLKAAGFTAGDLVVDQVSNGANGSNLTNAATAVVLNEYNPGSQTLVQAVALATDGTGVTQSGTAGSEGFIHFSADGSQLLISGYTGANASAGSVAPGTTAGANGSSIVNANSTAVPRGIAEFGVATGAQTSLTTLGTAFNANNIRSSASPDGTTLFSAGANTGQVTSTAGGSTSTLISSTKANARDIGIYGGSLYISSSSATNGAVGIYQVGALGSAYSTSTGQTANIVLTPATGTGNNSPYGFSISPNGLTLYVADSGGTISKYTRGATTSVFNATPVARYTNAADGFTGLTVDYSTNTVYAVDPTNVFSFADQGTSFSVPTTIATDNGTSQAFRSLDFVPVPEPATWAGGALSVLALAWAFARRRLGAGLKMLGLRKV